MGVPEQEEDPVTTRRPALAALHGTYAAWLGLFTAAVVAACLAMMAANGPALPAEVWTRVALAATVGVAAGPALHLVAALGLYRGSRWSRTYATVLSLLSLTSFPGCLLGGLTLWALHGETAAQVT